MPASVALQRGGTLSAALPPSRRDWVANNLFRSLAAAAAAAAAAVAGFLAAFVGTRVVMAADVAVGARRTPALEEEAQGLALALAGGGRPRPPAALGRELAAAAEEARAERTAAEACECRCMTLADVRAAAKLLRRRG